IETLGFIYQCKAKRAERIDHEGEGFSRFLRKRELESLLLSRLQALMQRFEGIEHFSPPAVTHQSPNFVEDLLELAIIVLQEHLVSLLELGIQQDSPDVGLLSKRSNS